MPPRGHDATELIVDDQYREADVELFNLIASGSRQPEFTGIKALMLAVLDDAIVVYLGRPGRARDEAEAWIMTGQRRSPFAFVIICDILGLEPEPVRVVLRRWRERSVVPRQALGRPRRNAQSQPPKLQVRAPYRSRKSRPPESEAAER
jgi:hypothetical protein